MSLKIYYIGKECGHGGKPKVKTLYLICQKVETLTGLWPEHNVFQSLDTYKVMCITQQPSPLRPLSLRSWMRQSSWFRIIMDTLYKDLTIWPLVLSTRQWNPAPRAKHSTRCAMLSRWSSQWDECSEYSGFYSCWILRLKQHRAVTCWFCILGTALLYNTQTNVAHRSVPYSTVSCRLWWIRLWI